MQTLKQLRTEAISLGLRVHHKHNEDTLRDMIAVKKGLAQPTENAVEVKQELPIRTLIYKNNGEKMWVMTKDVQLYQSNGWLIA